LEWNAELVQARRDGGRNGGRIVKIESLERLKQVIEPAQARSPVEVRCTPGSEDNVGCYRLPS
jgi:transcription elongation GreA/GreB family factor